jgi:glycine/D-amino acid oxidase-like deaminating enzyme
MPRACVVGAGISGVSTALFLQQQGYEVVVVDQRPGPAQGATSIAPGLIPQAAQSFAHYHILNTLKGRLCPWTAYTGENDERNRYSWDDLRNAFGWDFFKSCMPWNSDAASQNLSRLAHANYTLVRDLIVRYKLDVPCNFGLLRVFTSRSQMLATDEWHKVVSAQVKDYDGFSLEAPDLHRLLPSTQNPTTVALGGYLNPSTMVLDPKRLTTELARACADNKVEFRYNTQVLGLMGAEDGADSSTKAASAPHRVAGVMTSAGPIAADAVVLCSGLSAHVLTDGTSPSGPGAVVPLVPIKSVGMEVVDTTPNNGRLPAIFPGRPGPAFIPPLGSADTSEATRPFGVIPQPRAPNDRSRAPSPYFTEGSDPATLAGPLALARADPAPLRARVAAAELFPAAVEFSRTNSLLFMPPAPASGELPPPDLAFAAPALAPVTARMDAGEGLALTQVSDVLPARAPSVLEALSGPFGALRRFRVVAGQDMSEIDPALPERHMTAILKTLDIVKRVTRSAHAYVSQGATLHKAADATLISERRLELCAPAIALHTTSRDGLPVTGRVPAFANVYVNSGHGPAPLQTAVAGGQLTAAAVAADLGVFTGVPAAVSAVAVDGSDTGAASVAVPACVTDPTPFAAGRFAPMPQRMTMFSSAPSAPPAR